MPRPLTLTTPDLADLASGPAQVIFDQIANRVYLPHSEALRPQTRTLYEAAGLGDDPLAGPCLIEEGNTVSMVPAGAQVRLRSGHLVLELSA